MQTMAESLSSCLMSIVHTFFGNL